MRGLRLSILVVAALALAAPGLSAAKKKPPPPPPDSAADCTLVVEPFATDYLVLVSMNVGVSCATTKQSITVSSQLTRDGVVLDVLPLGSGTRTCANASACFISYDLFSIDTLPAPTPGNQVYCATGSGLVGGVTLGPATACEEDDRL